MLHNNLDFQQVPPPRSDRRLAGKRPRRDNQGSPLRVLPLALGAVVAALLLSYAADAALWNVSGERYAAEVLNDALYR